MDGVQARTLKRTDRKCPEFDPTPAPAYVPSSHYRLLPESWGKLTLRSCSLTTLNARGNHISKGWTTHVTELWVARLRVWDQFRSMLAVNSTLLSDDLGLKHFNAQE